MPSDLHEVVLELLRASPHRILDVLRDTTGAELIADVDPSRARVVDPTVSQLVGAAHACDLVIEIPVRGTTVATVIVEVQLRRRRRKELSWPLYWAAGRMRAGGGTVCVVVITTRPSVSRWAAHTLSQVIPPAGRWVVIGPGATEPILDPGVATRDPEAALVSALIHAGRDDVRLVPAIADAYSTLPSQHGMLIQDLLLTRLSRDAVSALEAYMQKTNYVWKSEFAIRHREEGREKGREEGREEGVGALRRLLASVIADGGLRMNEDQQTAVRECSDVDQLERWIRRATRATEVAEIFRSDEA